MNLKPFIVGIVTVAALAIVSMTAHASYYNPDPYDGINRIGAYYQYTNQVAYNYEGSYNYQFYDYVAPPRCGGWFGSTTGWITGLRSCCNTPVPPVHYTNYYTPVSGYPSWFGGSYGYPRATASSFPPYRERIGGIFSY